MKNVFVFLCLALCATLALGGYRPPQCRNFNRCGAQGSISIGIRGPGKCTAQANAFCATQSVSSGHCFDVAPVHKRLGCYRYDYREADAKCWAGVAVQAYTSASSKVDCHGKHVYSCANSKAASSVVACSIARAVVDMAVYFGRDREPTCRAAIDVLIPAIAEAATYSSSGVCISGSGWLADADHDYAGAFQVVFAKAFAQCFTYCDKNTRGVYVNGGGEAGVKAEGKIELGDGSRARLGGRPRPRRPSRPTHQSRQG